MRPGISSIFRRRGRMSARQERVSFPMRLLFTLFALDVGAVVAVIHHRTLPSSAAPAAARYFEVGMAVAAAAILGALVWMWWRPLRAIAGR